MTDLLTRLREAADEMRRGVHSPGHVATIMEAIEALERSPWISVKEKLPERRDWYLAITENNDIFVCDYIPSVRQWWTVPGDELYISGITHWMPLPEPPEEE